MNKLHTMRIGYLKILDHLILGFAGDASGSALLKHTSHSIIATPMGSWKQIIKSFCDGELHGAFVPAPEAMSLFDSGMDIKILLSDIRPGAYLLGNREAGVNKLVDLKGKTVLLSDYLSVHHLLFYRLMATAGLRAGLEQSANADVYIEVVPQFIVLEMIQNDSSNCIGGCFIEEPFGSTVLESGYGKLICPSTKIWPSHPGSVLIFHDYVIKDYRNHLMDVIHLLVASSRFIYKNSNDLHRFLRNFFDQDSEINQVIDKMFSYFLPKNATSLMPDIKSLEIINRFMVKDMGIMERILDISKLVDTTFALEAGA